MLEQLDLIRTAGILQIRVDGSGEIAEVCRLTCLEQGIEVVETGNVPQIIIQDLKVHFNWNGLQPHSNEGE